MCAPTQQLLPSSAVFVSTVWVGLCSLRSLLCCSQSVPTSSTTATENTRTTPMAQLNNHLMGFNSEADSDREFLPLEMLPEDLIDSPVHWLSGQCPRLICLLMLLLGDVGDDLYTFIEDMLKEFAQLKLVNMFLFCCYLCIHAKNPSDECIL